MASGLDRWLLPWIGTACRHIPDDSRRGVLDVRFAGRGKNNRWNVFGQPTFYLAGDHGVALAEFARHFPADRGGDVGVGTELRRVYDLDLRLDRVLDLRDPTIWPLLVSIGDPASFLDRTAARTIANYIRATTAAQAILVPSVAFLDDPARWVLAVFLEKVSPPDRFVTAVRKDGAFRVEP